MIGYKILNKDLSALYFDFTYKVGQTYRLPDNEKIKIGEYGYHFFQTLKDVNDYIGSDTDMRKGCDIYRIDVLGRIEGEDREFVTDEIKICERISADEEKQIEVLRKKYDRPCNIFGIVCISLSMFFTLIAISEYILFDKGSICFWIIFGSLPVMAVASIILNCIEDLPKRLEFLKRKKSCLFFLYSYLSMIVICLFLLIFILLHLFY